MSGRFEHAARAWWDWQSAMAWQLALLVAVVLALELALGRRARPRLRAALWNLVLLKLALPPWIASPVSVTRWLPESPSAPASAGIESASRLPAVLFLAWLAFLALAACACALRYARLRSRWLRGARRAPNRALRAADELARRLGLARAPELVVAPASSGPALLGFLRPVVCLPPALAHERDARRLRCALAHELAHVRRRDPLASLLALALQIAYAFHPLAWLVARRASALRELRCDELALRALQGKADYRRTLLEMARPLLERASPGRLAFLAPRARILERIEVLDRPRARRPALERAGGSALVALVLACCIPLARASTAPIAGEPFVSPPLDLLQGCLQRHYAVLGLLARETSTSAEPDPEGTSITP